MDSLTNFFNSDFSLWGLFLSSLLSATLLPGSSEVVLLGVLKLHPDLRWQAVLAGTLGNTAGGMLTFAMSWWWPLKKEIRHIDKVRRYGTPALLFSWAPFIGDTLCMAAGWIRLNPWYSLFFIAVGKFARYAAIAMAF